MFSLNCLFLGETSFKKIFQVTVPELFLVDNACISVDQAQVGHFKSHIWSTKKAKFSIDDSDNMDLYRVNVDDECKLIGVSTPDDIVHSLGGTFMLPQKFFKNNYFSEELSPDNIHIIISIPTSTGKYLPMFYLSNKKFAVTKYQFGLISFFFQHEHCLKH
jgi:hypothetical protein